MLIDIWNNCYNTLTVIIDNIIFIWWTISDKSKGIGIVLEHELWKIKDRDEQWIRNGLYGKKE